MRIVVIGATGTIGRQVYLDTKEKGYKVVGTYVSQQISGLLHFDITQTQLLKIIPDLSKTDVVIILAAYKNLNWIHSHPNEASSLNVAATKNIIQEVFGVQGKIVFLSSEQVFDGATGGYREEDIPNPQTVYGQQKLIVENDLQNSCNNWIIIRTGANVGFRIEDDCPILNTYRTMLKPNAKMAINNILSLTSVIDTSEQIINIIRSGNNGIFHVVANPPISRIELASLIKDFSKFGDKMRFEEVPHDEIQYPEPRPVKSWLSNEKIRIKYKAKMMAPEELIRKKVSIIDDWYNTNKLSFH